MNILNAIQLSICRQIPSSKVTLAELKHQIGRYYRNRGHDTTFLMHLTNEKMILKYATKSYVYERCNLRK